jgi:2',3'-cyclic-nucleotide 2'-phosphodiesterase (5'-nucleotidase family)
MKKNILVLLFILVSILTGCVKDDTPYIVDCERFPTHEDCLTDEEPIVCDEGYILDGENCIEISGEPDDYLDIYYLNDFHGALLPASDQIGISYIGNLIKTKKQENPDNVLFLAGGDMLQGSALSNYYNGLSTIRILNEMGLDAFTLGNHEFDWGLDTIQAYMDGNDENGEAIFPFLGANIFLEGTNNLPDYVDPYTIITKGTHKIGIIGTMGYGLESSIATSKITGFEFADPIPIIKEYTSYLRTEENCDIIIVLAHDSGAINNTLADQTGEYRVDAIFNGHSHSLYSNIDNNVAIVQSGSNGEYVGHVRFTFNDGTLPTIEMTQISKYMDALLSTKDETIDTMIEEYLLETDELFNDEIIVSNDYFSSSELTTWVSELIRLATNADIAFHNYGGTRTSIDDQESITLGLLYQIWPFDNVIKTVELTGAEINALLAGNSLGYSTTISTFDPTTLYLVATNDYVFDKETNPFINGNNPTNTGLLLRDLALAEMVLQAELYPTFDTENDILTTPTPPQSSLPRIKKED